jgi:hypothetical protein
MQPHTRGHRLRAWAAIVAGVALLAGIAVSAAALARSPRSGPVLLQPTWMAADSAAAPSVRAKAGAGGAASASTSRRVDPHWVATNAARTGIPAPALTAYADASLAAPCSVGWTTLAGIGWVESQNGTIGGRTLSADGRPSRPIVGVPLDGSGRVAAVPDGSGGWQHAVGPLQFLPSTWRQWATDGDGDGVADPQDINDAALAAARYLCASGQDLTTGAGWSAAVFSYNHDDGYVRAVYDAATTYAARAG